MTDTTAQHIAARDDEDLRARLIAVAEQAHIPNAEQFVMMNLGTLISTELQPGTTITSVHAYAAEQYRQAVEALPPKPGINPATVTDSQLTSVISSVWGPQE